MSASGMDGAARSTQRKVLAAGFSQTRSMLLTRSVWPFRWMKIVTSLISYFGRERRLRGGQARDRHAVRRGADVVHAGLLEEVNRRGIAAVLAADPDLQIR